MSINPSQQNQIDQSHAAHLKKRHSSESRFKLLGIASLIVALAFLVTFIFTLIQNASPAFTQTEVRLDIHYDPQVIDLSSIDSNDAPAITKALSLADYNTLIERALIQLDPHYTGDPDDLRSELLSSAAQYRLMDAVKADPAMIGTTQEVWLPASGGLDSAFKGLVDTTADESNRAVSNEVLDWSVRLSGMDRIHTTFNGTIFTHNDSRSPQDAGVKGALIGSFFTLLVTLALSFPIAVLAAVYLEEFAPKNKFTDFLEANINNLAAVPSIVFGLLGLAVFINFFGLPRSTPLVGGLVLTLMTLPTIIISSRAALKAVPPSIRSAAMGLGASKMQVTFHHVLPLALPGMLTGTIIGMAQALGETAPLLMIGMVAFIADAPGNILDPAAVMPVQIYLWSDLPERAFVARTSFAIIILLAFLVLMNALAVLLRKKFERKW